MLLLLLLLLHLRRSRGEVLLFLHADTLLPSNWKELVLDSLQDPSVILGAFRFRCRERVFGISLVEFGTNFRSRFLSMPYGDQVLVMRDHDGVNDVVLTGVVCATVCI